MVTARPVQSQSGKETARYAEMFAALGSAARLSVLRALLRAHPEGMVVGEIQGEVGVAGSTLSHHLEKLRVEELITVERESTFLRYRANTVVLEELLGFLLAECCQGSRAVEAKGLIQICQE